MDDFDTSVKQKNDNFQDFYLVPLVLKGILNPLINFLGVNLKFLNA